MVANPQNQKMSVETYLRLDQDHKMRHEYLDGYVYTMSGGTTAHARIAFNMAKLLDAVLTEKPCRAYTSNVRVQLSEERHVYPDVTVSCDSADHQEQENTIHAPRLVVEVLSPGTEAYDRGKKFLCYQECSTLQEYVMVNSRYQSVEVFRRQGKHWSYTRFGPGEEVELESLDIRFGFSLLYERVRIPVKEEQ
jgi:Uma2 family endonuclease